MDQPPAPALSSSASEQQLDHRVLTLWRLQRLISLGLIGVPMAVAIAVGLDMVAPRSVGLAAAGALLAWRLLMALVWPALLYDSYRYAVRDHDLLVRSGVLWRRWSCVPLGRIQHVDTQQGPMERMLGLSRLAVYTAAGMSADGVIPGLAEEEAERMRNHLSRRGGDDGV